MSIIKEYLNSTDLSVLAVWMRTNLVPDYFAAITYDSETSTITCTDAEENVLLTWSKNDVNIYTSETGVRNSHDGYGRFGAVQYASKCANGAIITFDNSVVQVLITKTNNDKTAFVLFTYHASLVTANDLIVAAWGDVTPYTTLAFTPVSKNQTQFVSFTTDAPIGTVSYTPNAFYIPAGQNYGMPLGTIVDDGYYYLTNGYWAIRDEAVS